MAKHEEAWRGKVGKLSAKEMKTFLAEKHSGRPACGEW